MIVSAALSAVLLAAAAGGTAPAWFTDATERSGLPAMKYGEGACFFDLNGDGLPELFLPDVKGRDRLFRNRGGGRFEDATEASGIRESGGIGAVAGDLDGDGREELYIVRGAYPYGTNVLYATGPDNVFRDVSGEAGASGRKNGISAVLGDVDGDGRLDIFVSNWGTNSLFRNRSGKGRLRFEDATREAGLSAEGRSWGAVLSDLTGDGKPDLVVVRGGAGRGEDPKMYVNRGDGTFEDASAASGLRGVSWSMAAVSADFDGDGAFDLFLTGYDGRDRLFRNDGHGRFTDVTEESGIRSGRSVGATAGDIDGDLRPDLVVAGFQGPVRVYRNLAGMRFDDAGAASGTGPWTKNEGAALADVDDDGDLDLYVANYDGHNRLYRNDLDDRRFLKVRLPAGGGPTFGAVARLYRAGDLGRRDRLLASQELHGGYGFCSQSPPEFLFRLPDDGPYDLRVIFPGGRRADATNVAPGRLTVRTPEEGH